MSNRKRLRQGPPPAPTARRIVPIVVAFAVGALLAGPVGVVSAGAGDPAGERVSALRAEEAKRDVAQVVELTAHARRVQESLLPVLDGLAAAVPVGKAPGPATSMSTVEQWQVVTGKAVDDFADPPSGGTGVNVARSGLAAAVRALDGAVDTYAAALAQPPAAHASLFALAGRQRDTAVATWSSAATQLDVLNVDAGNGHVHVFLPAAPGQGALAADGAPEGK
ncbi:hypothetical protein [Phytohabitans aurantiacus]|jgi:hypothetical protein|uniref:DUF4439 domain-containing protein n=1 Tax=Phytohabitans aurantiacus TaxID=3016789 RepID=A0ABQ5QYQ7_9ACTN|nr:hypothetical protein [Phytohabitans aurantiacus]GLH99640.1 hypothetical protein Pa4123_49160 [Phytohabitans aurantiacus]